MNINSVKRSIRASLSLLQLVTGLVVYAVGKKTMPFAYQAMITLFCITRGRSTDILSRIIGLFKQKYDLSNAVGVLGDMCGSDRDYAVAQLRERGFHVFEKRLPDLLCDRLLQYALSCRSKIRPMDGDVLGEPIDAIYDRAAPIAIRYDFPTQDLLDNPDVQSLLADMSFAAVAQSYLGCRPVIDIVTMWWHTSFGGGPDSRAAQFFHFDMDRVKWVKFFIYLTDVEATSGPHIFVAGSHKTDGIPADLLKKGYARSSDEEIETHYPPEDIIEFTGPRGTIIVEDTRGLHKGMHVQSGDRLMLQFEFCNSMFGGDYAKARMSQNVDGNLKKMVEKFPCLYAPYL